MDRPHYITDPDRQIRLQGSPLWKVLCLNVAGAQSRTSAVSQCVSRNVSLHCCPGILFSRQEMSCKTAFGASDGGFVDNVGLVSGHRVNGV